MDGSDRVALLASVVVGMTGVFWPKMAATVLFEGPRLVFLGVLFRLGPFLLVVTGIGILDTLAASLVLNRRWTTLGVAGGSCLGAARSPEGTVCKQMG